MKNQTRYIVVLVLALVSLTVQAQEAFYIYQNDGHFDGFFYDEVQKMSYSKLDTLGFEHEDFVSQEIITADSTYRIMLTAIDSVGFQQPKIEFRSNVHNVREEGLMEYYGTHDFEEMKIYFYRDTPADKLPRVGDVLVDFDLEEGFSGKVTEVEDLGYLILVHYAPLESIRDVFQRFVCVEQFDHDNAGNMVRRRVAGVPELTKGDWNKPKRASANFDFRLLNMDFGGHIPLVAEDDLTVSLDINTHVAMSLKGSYNINLIDPIYIGLTFTSDLAFALGITLDGKISTIIDKSSDFIPGIPVPAAAPIFELRNIPGLFARGEAHVKFSASLVNLSGAKVWHKLEFNDDWIPSLTYGRLAGEAEAEQPGTNHIDQYVEFNGFVQAGLHAPLTLSTNRWLSKFFKAEIGTHLYIGPKLSGAIQLNFVDMMKNGASVYNALKNTALTLTPLSVDFETKATTKGFFGGESEFTFGDGSISVIKDYSLYLLPEFDSWKEEVDPHDSDGNVREGTYVGLVCKDRATLFPYQIGLRLFRKTSDNMYEPLMGGDIWQATGDKGWTEEWHYGDDWIKSTNILDYPHFSSGYIPSSGEYRLRPIFKYGDMVFEGAPDYDCWLGDYIKIKPTTIETSNKVGDEVRLSVETNMKLEDNIDVGLTFSIEDWNELKSLRDDIEYRARYEKTSEYGGELCITNVKTNNDPFRNYAIVCNNLTRMDQNGNISSMGELRTPLTIIQAPNTNAKFNEFFINALGDFPDANFAINLKDLQPISMNDGAFSFTHTNTSETGYTTETITVSGTLSPDERGWGYFRISGNYTIDKVQDVNYKDAYGNNHRGRYLTMKTNASFSSSLKMNGYGSWVLCEEGVFSINGTSTSTRTLREMVYDTVKETTTTETYSCNEGYALQMVLDTKDNMEKP